MLEHEQATIRSIDWATVPLTQQLRTAAEQLRVQARDWRRLLDRADRDQRVSAALRVPQQLEPGPLERELAGVA